MEQARHSPGRASRASSTPKAPDTTKKGLPKKNVSYISRDQRKLLDQSWAGSARKDALDTSAVSALLPVSILEEILREEVELPAAASGQSETTNGAARSRPATPAPASASKSSRPRNSPRPSSQPPDVPVPSIEETSSHKSHARSQQPEDSDVDEPIRTQFHSCPLSQVSESRISNMDGGNSPQPASRRPATLRESSPIDDLDIQLPGALIEKASSHLATPNPHSSPQHRRSRSRQHASQRHSSRPRSPLNEAEQRSPNNAENGALQLWNAREKRQLSPPVQRRHRMKTAVFPDLDRNRRATLPAPSRRISLGDTALRRQSADVSLSRARTEARVFEPDELQLEANVASHPNPARISAPPNAYTWRPPYETFKASYPDFRGSLKNFLDACYCVHDYVKRGKLVSFLCDDVIRAYMDYINYVHTTTATASNKPMHLETWYNRNATEYIYRKKVITSDNVAAVLAAYPDNMYSIQKIVHDSQDSGGSKQRAHISLQEPVDGGASVAAIPPVANELMERVSRHELSPPSASLAGLIGSGSTDSSWQHGQLHDPHLDLGSFRPDSLADDNSESQSQIPNQIPHLIPNQILNPPHSQNEHQEKPSGPGQVSSGLETTDTPLRVPSSPIQTAAIPPGMDKIWYMLQSPAELQVPPVVPAPVGETTSQKRRRQEDDATDHAPANKRRALEAVETEDETDDEFEPLPRIIEPAKKKSPGRPPAVSSGPRQPLVSKAVSKTVSRPVPVPMPVSTPALPAPPPPPSAPMGTVRGRTQMVPADLQGEARRKMLIAKLKKLKKSKEKDSSRLSAA